MIKLASSSSAFEILQLSGELFGKKKKVKEEKNDKDKD
jgi:hypothetical protein